MIRLAQSVHSGAGLELASVQLSSQFLEAGHQVVLDADGVAPGHHAVTDGQSLDSTWQGVADIGLGLPLDHMDHQDSSTPSYFLASAFRVGPHCVYSTIFQFVWQQIFCHLVYLSCAGWKIC